MLKNNLLFIKGQWIIGIAQEAEMHAHKSAELHYWFGTVIPS